jgi:hypothetical protein
LAFVLNLIACIWQGVVTAVYITGFFNHLTGSWTIVLTFLGVWIWILAKFMETIMIRQVNDEEELPEKQPLVTNPSSITVDYYPQLPPPPYSINPTHQ